MSNKMKPIFIIIAGLTLVAVGIFASFLLTQRFRADATPATVNEVTVKTEVVVVTRDLFLGDLIAGSDVKLVSVPVEIAPRDTIAILEEAVGKIRDGDYKEVIDTEFYDLHEAPEKWKVEENR